MATIRQLRPSATTRESPQSSVSFDWMGVLLEAWWVLDRIQNVKTTRQQLVVIALKVSSWEQHPNEPRFQRQHTNSNMEEIA